MGQLSAGGPMTLVAGGSLVAAAWWLELWGYPPSLDAVVATLPIVLGGIVILLAIRFRRSRLAGASSLIVVTAWILMQIGRAPGAQHAVEGSLFLLPAGLAALALLSDRPVLSREGMAQLLPSFGLGIFFFLLVRSNPSIALTSFVSPRQLAWAMVLAALVMASLGYIFRRGVMDAAFLPALAAVALVLGRVHAGSSGAMALAAAQAVFLVAGAEEAYRLAFHDELTGLAGRRAFDEALRRLRGDFAVAMLDIDYFKRFNDRFGHDAGDQVLRMVARELVRVPAGGKPYRYGGEEFVLLFPGLSCDAAVTATEAVRGAIARRRFQLRAVERPKRKPRKPVPASRTPVVNITLSAGVAGSVAGGKSPQEVLLEADSALYKAKKRGRNRVQAARGGKKKPDRAVRGKMNGDT